MSFGLSSRSISNPPPSPSPRSAALAAPSPTRLGRRALEGAAPPAPQPPQPAVPTDCREPRWADSCFCSDAYAGLLERCCKDKVVLYGEADATCPPYPISSFCQARPLDQQAGCCRQVAADGGYDPSCAAVQPSAQ